MHTVGGIVLHELMHWPGLLDSVPFFDDIIEEGKLGFPQIGDFPGPDPFDGYGFFHSQKIHDIQNADNYRSYAESKYWQWKCGRTFGPSIGLQDDTVRTSERNEPAQPESDNS